MNWKRVGQIVLGVVGLTSLIWILKTYGVREIAGEFQKLGPWTAVLILSFLPTVVCYSAAWILVTEFPQRPGRVTLQRLWLLSRIMVTSISWNNLTPFLKVGGEPFKWMALRKHLDSDRALESVVVYNLAHLLGTLLAFFVCALVLIVCFPAASSFEPWLWLVVLGSVLSAALIWFLPGIIVRRVLRHRSRSRSRSQPRSRLRKYGLKFAWQFRRSVRWGGRNVSGYTRLGFAVVIEAIARWAEGLTFYVAFLAMGLSISLFESGTLDVARTIVDTGTFFVPYQLGTRESGVSFVLEHVLGRGVSGALTAVLAYRGVEIIWLLIGLAISFTASRGARESKGVPTSG